MNMRRLLRHTAVALHRRGAHSLARLAMAEASGYPEADELPTPKQVPKDEIDFKVGMGDMGEDLGFEPYNRKRSKVDDLA